MRDAALPRMHASKSMVLAFALEGALAAAGCGAAPATSTTQLSMAQAIPPPVPPIATVTVTERPHLRSLAVLAVQPDDTSRRALEDALVAALRQHGVDAIASHEKFPDHSPARDEARKAIKTTGGEDVDGVLVTEWRGRHEEAHREPGPFRPDYWRVYEPITTPPSRAVETRVKTEQVSDFQTTLWDSRDYDELAWSARARVATSSSFSGSGLVQKVTKDVTSALASAGLIPP